MQTFRTTAKTLAYLITTAVIVSTVSAGWILLFGVRAKPSTSDCVIILGCGLYGSTPSSFLMARLDEGARLYREGYARRIIVSGGMGSGEDITEAEAMRKYLLDMDVDGADIITEEKSTSTLTNLEYSRAKMKEHNLTTAIVVSNAYHLARCSVIAKRLGIEATFSGVEVPQHRQTEWAGFLREIPAVIYTFVTGG